MAASAREFFETLESRVDPSQTAGMSNSYVVDVEGAGQWKVDVRDGNLEVTEGDGDADVRVSVGEQDFLRLVDGKLSPMTAYMTGKVKVKGDMGALMKLQKIF